MRVPWIALLLAVAVAVLSISPTLGASRKHQPQPAPAACESFTDCNDCTSEPLCGWCDTGDDTVGSESRRGDDPTSPFRANNRFAKNRLDNSYCSQGTIGGPTGATCPGLWQFDDCSNEEECNVREQCGKCLDPSLPQVCGWCDTRCVSGNEAGPSDTEIECMDYLFPPETCSDVDCSSLIDCGVCAASSFCGWCSNSTLPNGEQCLPGGLGGPSDPLACSEEEWHPLVEECRPPLNPCDYPGCDSCLGAESEECVWCASESICLEANSYYTEECQDLRADSCDGSCEDYQFCNNCVQDAACGWCATELGDVCVSGDVSAPYFNASKCETYSYESCPTCNSLETCKDCFTNLNCEWCFVNQSDQITGVCLDVGLPGGDKTCYNSTIECNSPLPSATPSVSPTLSNSKTISRSPSPSLSMTPTLTSSPSNSTTASFTPSNSTTATRTPDPSRTASASWTSSRSFSVAESQSKSRSHSKSKSFSISLSASKTISNSPTSSRSVTATETISVTPSKSLSPSATASRPASTTRSVTSPEEPISTLSTLPETTDLSTVQSSLDESPASEDKGVNWIIWGPVIGISVIVVIVLVFVCAYLFYTKYWKKRWYYMKLK